MAISDHFDWTDPSSWSGTRAPLEQATGLAPAAYSSEHFHRLERDRVFGRAWVCIGLAADVAAPGRLLVRNVGDRSILVTRGVDGRLRGFLNSCRHRGTELAETDCDISGTIRCPYHRWGYSTDGSLMATPFFEDVPRPGFDRAAHGLVPVRVDTWGMLLFACLDPDTPPLQVWLGDLPERLAGYDLGSWRPHRRRTLEIEADWKLISENYQEYYHLRWVHPELAKVSRVDDHYRYQGPGMYCGQTTTPVTGDDRDDWLVLPPKSALDRSDGCSGRFVAIFPNVLLSVLPNHVFVMRLDPDGPGRTVEACTLLLPAESGRGVAAEAIDATWAFWFDVNGEDIDIVQRSQRGLSRGSVPAGPLSPRFEEPLHRFHNMLADHMTLPSMRQLSPPPGDTRTERARLGTGPNPNPPAVDVAESAVSGA